MLYSDTESIAFEGGRRIARGPFVQVARTLKRAYDKAARQNLRAPLHVLDAASSEPIEFDWRGTADDVQARATALPTREPQATATKDESPSTQPRGPGRPRLGVIAREVTLLPRHWEWLASQPGGASVALRKLVEAARKGASKSDHARQARDAAYRFMFTVAGNDAGFEEAARALFAGDAHALAQHTAAWPDDVRAHLEALIAGAANQDRGAGDAA